MFGCNSNCKYLYDKGHIARLNSKFQEAINLFNKAEEFGCSGYDLFIERGLAYKNINQLKLALKDYYKALSIDSTKSDIYNNIGVVFIEQKQYNDAFKILKKSIIIDSTYSLGYLNLGYYYCALKDFDMAINSFLKAQNLNDKFDINIPYNLSICYDSLYNKTLALRYYKEFALHIKHADIYYNLALKQIDLKMADSAIFYLHKSLVLNSNVHVLNMLGLAYDLTGQYLKSIEYYYLGLQTDSLKSILTYNITYPLEKLRRYKEAINLIDNCNCHYNSKDFNLAKRKNELENKIKN